jgi:hypothetical protein
MKAKKTIEFLEGTLKIPVCYGRPNTPDDEPWIESLNKNSKYHRDAPSSFATVADVLDWLQISDQKDQEFRSKKTRLSGV